MRKLLVLMIFGASAASAQYVAEILPTPNGTGRAEGAGGGQIVGIAFGAGGGAALWNGASHTFSVLDSTGYTGLDVRGVGGGKQVGYGFANGHENALMWSGSGAPINLHNNAFLGTIAWATDGTSQVGEAGVVQGLNVSNAVLWHGTAASAVNLHPAGYVGENSSALGVFGDVQVGSVSGQNGGAAIWRGTAESMQLLPVLPGHRPGGAYSVHGEQIVGSNAPLSGNDGQHAVLWSTDGKTVTNLSPVGWGSFALDTNGVNQVGQAAQVSGEGRAVVWAGSAQSMLNLHQFLPGNVTESIATGIDENGAIVGWGTITGLGQVPIVWTPVPEPSGFFALALGISALTMRRRRKR